MSKHVSKHKRLSRRFIRSTKAVSALEYAILVGVIAVGVGAAIVGFGDDIEKVLANIGDDVAAIDTTGGGVLDGNAGP